MHPSSRTLPVFTHVLVENHAPAIKPYISPEVLRFAQDDSSWCSKKTARHLVPSAQIFIRSRVEQLLVICHAEVIGFAFVNRFGCTGLIDIHLTNSAQRMC